MLYHIFSKYNIEFAFFLKIERIRPLLGKDLKRSWQDLCRVGSIYVKFSQEYSVECVYVHMLDYSQFYRKLT